VSSRLFLQGIRAEGRHGANPGERDSAQPFVVDVEVFVHVESDSLDRTLDYRVVADSVQETVAGTSFVLLETLAEEIARAVFQYAGVERVTAVVHKPAAAEALGLDDVSAEATVG
jgi:dihydroneopterin aldolase